MNETFAVQVPTLFLGQFARLACQSLETFFVMLKPNH